MKKWLYALMITAAVTGNALAMVQLHEKPGEKPMNGHLTPEQIQQERNNVERTGVYNSAPKSSGPEIEPENTTMSADDSDAANALATSAEAPKVDDEQVLKTAEQDIQSSKPRPWWSTPLLVAICAAIGYGAFYAFTQWANKITPPVNPTKRS